MGPERVDWPPAERVRQARTEFAAQATADLTTDRRGELYRNSVAHLLILAGAGPVEDKSVRKPLQPRRLPDCDRAVLLGVRILAGLWVPEASNDSSRHPIPRHPAVAAGVILAQSTPHPRWQHVEGQAPPVLSGTQGREGGSIKASEVVVVGGGAIGFPFASFLLGAARL